MRTVNASELAKMLKAEAVVVATESLDAVGIDEKLASELKDLVDLLVPAEKYEGYGIVKGKHLVFKRWDGGAVIAVVEEDRLRWCMNKMREMQWQ